MDDENIIKLENEVLDAMTSKLTGFMDEKNRNIYIEHIIRSIEPGVTKDIIKRITEDANVFAPLDDYINNEEIEDIMVNNLDNIFVYKTGIGQIKLDKKIKDRQELELLVKKLKLYATATSANRNIFDAHLPSGSRANIVESPVGANITIRNFRVKAFSIIDMINSEEISYNMAARLWLYAEGLGLRPANLVFGGMPAAGKTSLLNSMFSFFRPEQRVVVIEETYELNTETQENCVRLETSIELSVQELVENALRMRPDMLIIGEVRGKEAKDMMTAMNIGKICMSTIHASTTRDIIVRLEHTPMNVERDIIPLIDAIILVSQVNDKGKLVRKVTQVSEISGIETQVLLSDLYKYDYKTGKGTDVLPSITYRDTLSKLSGLPPSQIIEEEQRRSMILRKLNKIGIRDVRGINEFCKEYYDNPDLALKKIDFKQA